MRSRNSRRTQKQHSEFKNLIEESASLLDQAPLAVQEAYKTLRTNIMFSLPEKSANCIGITSATKGEGKSSVALNLAIAFGQIGKKVLLIDCDLRLPSIAAKIGFWGEPGLTNIVMGEGHVEDCIKKLYRYKISVIPAGSLPSDPTSILASKQMDVIINAAKKHYDYIILDLPPVTAVADATIMARHVSGFLLVLRHDFVEYRDVEEMLSQFNITETKILGFVYNDAHISENKYYKGYY